MKKSRISYLCILFLSLIYIYFDGGFLPYTLFYIVLITPVVSVVYLIIIYTTFKYSENLNKREYVKGEVLEYTLDIHNRSPFYIAYFTVFMHMEGQMLIKGMKTEHLTIKPFKNQVFNFQVPIMYRGRYRVGISKIVIKDFLNLVSFNHTPGETKQIRVFPRILPLDKLDIPYIRISENEYLSQIKDRGSTEIHDIRDYIYGDSLKKIYWKLSSKHNKWLVKETNASTEKEFWIIVNLEKLEGQPEDVLKAEDRTIEVLVSLASLFISSGVVLKVCFFKNEEVFLTFSDISGFQQMYELFAFIPFNMEESFSNEMNYFIDSMHEQKSVLVFTPVFNENHLSALSKMKNAGHDVSLFFCEAEEGGMKKVLERALEKELPELGIKVIDMYKSLDQHFLMDITM